MATVPKRTGRDFREPLYDGAVSSGAAGTGAFGPGSAGTDAAGAGTGAMATSAVVIPVKAFSNAKMRLSAVLSPEERASLAREMAQGVIRAAQPLPAVVVCDDLEVAAWAENLGARALLEPGLGLNGAVGTAVSQLAAEGYTRLVVAHADLPLAKQLAWLAEIDGIALVPDRHLDGTNVISLPAPCGFRFSYGPGSFSRHQEEALRTGLPWQVIHDPGLAWDVDFPADMAAVTP
jgi:2-phospho-L-lactate/phosphoenolpyruvate guanylyltransferase